MSNNRVKGNLLGLKKEQKDKLERLFRRRIPPHDVTTHEFNRELCTISFEIARQVGVLISRRGNIEHVIVGDAGSIMLPDLGRSRGNPVHLRGLRYIHTHLDEQPLNDEDLTDLVLLRFDLVLAVTMDESGFPAASHLAHILPRNDEGKPVEIYKPFQPGRLDIDFQDLVGSLEEEIARKRPDLRGRDKEGVILVGTEAEGKGSSIDSLAELRELARSAGVDVVGEVVQKRKKVHPKTVLGKGKLREVLVKAMQLGAVTLLFDRELSPSQVNAIQNLAELKVIDRSQLILDIFAQRARTREGKIQVELAQLRYNLPKLVGKGVDMSRLTGGIGGRGPGETKLEIDRRRVRERINHLERQMNKSRKTRQQKREKRRSRQVPVVSIIGYANAGKSTLLNQLTNSEVGVQDKMFATLDPASRRLRFPREREIVVTDTVGFIRELPKDLFNAFKATLEELEDADLFLHVVDAADPSCEGQIAAVNNILHEMEFFETPRIIVLNKTDLISELKLKARLSRMREAIPISALDRQSFRALLEAMEEKLFAETEPDETAWQSLGF